MLKWNSTTTTKFAWLTKYARVLQSKFRVDGLTLSHDYDDLFVRIAKYTSIFTRIEQINYARKLHEAHTVHCTHDLTHPFTLVAVHVRFFLSILCAACISIQLFIISFVLRRIFFCCVVIILRSTEHKTPFSYFWFYGFDAVCKCNWERTINLRFMILCCRFSFSFSFLSVAAKWCLPPISVCHQPTGWNVHTNRCFD